MDKIIKYFKQWDKLAHMFMSCIIMLWFSALGILFLKSWLALIIGTTITAVCAFGKELFDNLTFNTENWKDLVADGIGWLLALIPLILIEI